MLIFVKLGGSLITDKTDLETFLPEVTARLAGEIASALGEKRDLKLLVGHGSGSFGHFAANRHGTIDGVRSSEQWRGFAEVSRAAARLNRLVTDVLWEAGVPVLTLQPSASARCDDGKLVAMSIGPVKTALEHDLVPLVYGDVAMDSLRGGTIISTEAIFAFLAGYLRPDRIYLVGDVPGVMHSDTGEVISHISPANLDKLRSSIGGSRGVDVTGGMWGKVSVMVELASALPGLKIGIFSGTEPGNLKQALLSGNPPGTVITA